MSASLASHEALLERLRPDAAYRVRERAAMIYYGRPEGSITWPGADALAYAQESTSQTRIIGT